MKPVVKQKLSTLQDIINKAQNGGGDTGDAYTKAEADAKFEAKTDAASTYLSKTDAASTYLSKTDATSTYLSKTDAASTYLSKTAAARMANKIVVESTAIIDSSETLVQFPINNINSLSELNSALVIINCIETLDNTFDFLIFIYISASQNYFLDSSSGGLSLDTLMEFDNNIATITKFGLDATQNGKKYRLTLFY